MSAGAFALALGAAVLHATWNALLARTRDVRSATSVALVVAVLLFAPFAAATWEVERAAVPWIVASAALELLYFLLLTAAYRLSDLSLVYPIARGSAPILVLVGATVAGITLGALQAVGVVLAGVGVMLVRASAGPSIVAASSSRSRSARRSPATHSSTRRGSSTQRPCRTSSSCWRRWRWRL